MAILNPTSTSNQTSQPKSDPLFVENRDSYVNDLEAAARLTSTKTSNSENDTLSKYQNAQIVDLNGEYVDERSINKSKSVGLLSRSVPGVPDGAELALTSPAKINFIDVNGNKQGKDLRVRILVPSKYLTGLTSAISDQGGIIFPYTPNISYEVTADYGSLNPMHSNFSISFYQRSKIGNITITGKFTVQNENDARKYMATKKLLHALTRMRSGGAKTGDPDSGAPPPVCRLYGYGDMVFENVPVAIGSFRIELPDSYDYMTYNFGSEIYSVPTVSTFAITCVPMFSRDEMQGFSVNSYLSGNTKSQGFV